MIHVFNYFDLNNRVKMAVHSNKALSDLRSDTETALKPDPQRAAAPAVDLKQPAPVPSPAPAPLPAPAPAQAAKMSMVEQLIMYFGTIIGVIFSSAVMQYKAGEFATLSITLTSVIFSAIIALIIIPVVFEKLSVKPDSPFLVRIGLFVQHGVFWQVILSAIGKTFVS